jgi:hypothetical protein
MLTADRPYADPEAAARRILEIAKQVEPAMKGGFISNWSTAHSCFVTEAQRRSTVPA